MMSSSYSKLALAVFIIFLAPKQLVIVTNSSRSSFPTPTLPTTQTSFQVQQHLNLSHLKSITPTSSSSDDLAILLGENVYIVPSSRLFGFTWKRAMADSQQVRLLLAPSKDHQLWSEYAKPPATVSITGQIESLYIITTGGDSQILVTTNASEHLWSAKSGAPLYQSHSHRKHPQFSLFLNPLSGRGYVMHRDIYGGTNDLVFYQFDYQLEGNKSAASGQGHHFEQAIHQLDATEVVKKSARYFYLELVESSSLIQFTPRHLRSATSYEPLFTNRQIPLLGFIDVQQKKLFLLDTSLHCLHSISLDALLLIDSSSNESVIVKRRNYPIYSHGQWNTSGDSERCSRRAAPKTRPPSDQQLTQTASLQNRPSGRFWLIFSLIGSILSILLIVGVYLVRYNATVRRGLTKLGHFVGIKPSAISKTVRKSHSKTRSPGGKKPGATRRKSTIHTGKGALSSSSDSSTATAGTIKSMASLKTTKTAKSNLRTSVDLDG